MLYLKYMMPSKTDINPATGKQYAINPATGNWDDNYWASIEKTLPGYAQEKAKQEQNALLAKQKAERDARYASNKAELGEYTTELETKVPQITEQVYSKYKIPDQVQGVNALNTRIAQLQTGSGMGETAGGYANAGQVDKALSTGYIPQFNTAAGNLNTSVGVAQTEYSNLIQPTLIKGNILTDRIARESTGYDTQQQNELDTLLTRYQMGVQMSENEKNRIHELAVNEKAYEFEKQKLASADKNTEIVTVGGRKKLIDKNTGETISDLGPSSDGSSGSGKTATNYLNKSATIVGGGSGISNNDWEYVTG